MEINRMAAGALKGCVNIADIDTIFSMFGIKELHSKIEHLMAAMGNVEIYMVPGDGKEESEYDTLIAMLLTEQQRSGDSTINES